MKFFGCVLMLIVLFGCEDSSIKISRGMYFWANNIESLSSGNQEALDSLKVEKLYVKIFEVDRIEGMNRPIAKSELHLDEKTTSRLELIPCIYFLNSVFIESSRSELDLLAANVAFLANKFITKKMTAAKVISYEELQIDCDWSEKSQGNYFYFLRKVKAESKKRISCTLRLYPYKFHEKMGVPPCDRAMLMCYNLLNPLANPRKNTILDVEEMGKYLDTKVDYPLQLDVALPIYSWVQCYENKRFKGVLNGAVDGLIPHLSHEKGLWYIMKKDTLCNDIYVRKGDRMKLERVPKKDLDLAIDRIEKIGILKDRSVLSFFHLSSNELNFYGYETIDAYYSRLSN